MPSVTGSWTRRNAGSEDGADSREDPELAAKIGALVERRKHKQSLRESLRESLRASGERRISEVDPDARALKKSGRTVGGCNCRIAAEDRCKLIVAEDVVQDGNEAGQLEPMMTKAGETLGAERLTGLADSGRFSGEQLKIRGSKPGAWTPASRCRDIRPEATRATSRDLAETTISVAMPGMTRMPARPVSG